MVAVSQKSIITIKEVKRQLQTDMKLVAQLEKIRMIMSGEEQGKIRAVRRFVPVDATDHDDVDRIVKVLLRIQGCHHKETLKQVLQSARSLSQCSEMLGGLLKIQKIIAACRKFNLNKELGRFFE